MGAPERVLIVSKIASLARLALSADEAVALQAQLDRVLDHVAQLHEADTSSLDLHTLHDGAVAPLADDLAVDSLARSEVLAQAPSSADGHFVVARFVEG